MVGIPTMPLQVVYTLSSLETGVASARQSVQACSGKKLEPLFSVGVVVVSNNEETDQIILIRLVYKDTLRVFCVFRCSHFFGTFNVVDMFLLIAKNI